MDVSKYSAYADYKWAVGLNRIALSVLGVWPKNNKTKQDKLKSNIRTLLILNIPICFCLIPTINSLLKVWGDLMSTIDNLQYTLPFSMAIIKLSIIWLKQKDVLPLLNMIKDDWLKPKIMQERDVMIKYARIARLLIIVGYFMMLTTFIVAVILPIFGISIRYVTNKTDPGKVMPLQTYYIYDRNRSPIYEITYILQSVSLMATATMYTTIDNFLGMLVFHVCGQLENLKMRIIHLDKFQNFEIGLSHSVQDHIRLIRFINKIDDIFTLI
ncbi:PREDICTED: uncharacterized protein LOC105562039, partial [Vollenhovia emeryi]|uniref:uncharacterized protein LOC105562039 n=1 Tax=Vollenhovia emeryi TaxID=411798 RepID=UPI0005F55EB5